MLIHSKGTQTKSRFATMTIHTIDNPTLLTLYPIYIAFNRFDILVLFLALVNSHSQCMSIHIY